MPVAVKGYRELMRALAVAEKDVRVGVRKELATVAQPVAQTAESLAQSEISHMTTVPWSRMRVGVTRTLVYVAPRERGVARKGNFARRRPLFADLLMGRAMEPALAKHAPTIERRVDELLDHVADKFNRGA